MSRLRLVIALALMVALIVVCAGSGDAEREHRAYLATARGEVEVWTRNGRNWSPASERMPLSWGDRIRTGADARAIIRLSNGNHISLAANSELALEIVSAVALRDTATVFGLFPSTHDLYTFTARLASGRAVGVLRNMNDGSSLRLLTPTAVVEASEAVFLAEIDGASTRRSGRSCLPVARRPVVLGQFTNPQTFIVTPNQFRQEASLMKQYDLEVARIQEQHEAKTAELAQLEARERALEKSLEDARAEHDISHVNELTWERDACAREAHRAREAIDLLDHRGADFERRIDQIEGRLVDWLFGQAGGPTQAHDRAELEAKDYREYCEKQNELQSGINFNRTSANVAALNGDYGKAARYLEKVLELVRQQSANEREYRAIEAMHQQFAGLPYDRYKSELRELVEQRKIDEAMKRADDIRHMYENRTAAAATTSGLTVGSIQGNVNVVTSTRSVAVPPGDFRVFRPGENGLVVVQTPGSLPQDVRGSIQGALVETSRDPDLQNLVGGSTGATAGSTCPLSGR